MFISDLNILETVTAANVIGGCGWKNNKRQEEEKYTKKNNGDRKYTKDNDESKKYTSNTNDNDTFKITQETEVKVTVVPKISIS